MTQQELDTLAPSIEFELWTKLNSKAAAAGHKAFTAAYLEAFENAYNLELSPTEQANEELCPTHGDRN